MAVTKTGTNTGTAIPSPGTGAAIQSITSATTAVAINPFIHSPRLAEAAAEAEITLESLLREVEEARRMAMSLKQSSAAVAAIKLKSELSGHYVQRKEDVTPRRSEAEIDARLRELLAGGDQAGSSGPAGTAPDSYARL
jgi:hypothetical protein